MATKKKEEWEKIKRKGMKYNIKVKSNNYDLFSKEYGVGFFKNGSEFYFDLEDYDKIKNYSWSITPNGYVRNYKNKILLHHFVLNYDKNCGMIPDHINRKRNDNRKENLRLVTTSQNNMNMSTHQKTIDNSGVKGVTWDKTKNNWQVTITLNKKLIKLGHFKKEDLESAIICRLKAEKEYFGEYSAQKELFKKYNI